MQIRTDAAPDSGTDDARMRVLIVGSDRVACTLAARLLERLGHPSAQQCPTLSEAASLQGGFDLILVDDSGINAGETPAATLRRGAAARLVFAGSSSAAHSIGADVRLDKPLTLAALGNALADILGTRGNDDFDDARWRELLGLFGRGGGVEMVGALRRDLPQQRLSFERAVQQHDGAALHRIAHGVRGAALQLGAEPLAALCTQIELQVAAGRAAEAEPLGTQMLSRYAALIARLQHELDRH